jgi:hypothetical protein
MGMCDGGAGSVGATRSCTCGFDGERGQFGG